jgi:hypothetical protein
MSCTSPFKFVAGVEYESRKIKMVFYGSTDVPAVYLPVLFDCKVGLKPGYFECTSTSCIGCLRRKRGIIKWENCCNRICTNGITHLPIPYLYDCKSSQGVKVIPDLKIKAAVVTSMTFETSLQAIITTNGFNATSTKSITIYDLSVHLIINGEDIWFEIPVTVTITDESGVFYATIPITSIKKTIRIGDINFDANIGVYLLACANPKPPMGWLNLKIGIELNPPKPEFGTNTFATFAIGCPIISAEDVDIE